MSALGLLGSALLDLVYPEHCVSCDRRPEECAWAEAGPLVPGLRRWDRPHMCSACERELSRHPVRSAVGSAEERLEIRAAAWSSRTLVSLVGGFKYHGVRGLAWPLARSMVHSLEDAHRDEAPPVLVPIPLHGARLRARGYNQSDLLARIIGRTLGWGVRSDILARVRRTGQQAKLSAAEARRRNLAGAFRARSATGENRPARVVLVDDLVTSGATLLSASRALAIAGWMVGLAVGAGCARGGGNSTAPVDTPAGDF